MLSIALASEDELSETIGLRLIEEVASPESCALRLRKNGFGYLKANISKFNGLAEQQPLLILTDLDAHLCASKLKASWLGKARQSENLLFRIAVREIESWILADHDAMYSLIGPRIGALPALPDQEKDPKRLLLKLAERAPKSVREELLPARGAIASQGIGYNSCLCEIVRNGTWCPHRAAQRSESLRRARIRIRELAERVI